MCDAMTSVGLTVCKQDHSFGFLFAVFAHSEKWRKRACKTLNLPTQHVIFPNMARYDCKHNTLRLKFTHVIFTETPRQKVCKNVQKVPVLLSVDANSAIEH